MKLKIQIFSRNLYGNVFPFYKKYTSGLILRYGCGYSFRNLTRSRVLSLLARGVSTVRHEEMD